MIFDSKNNHNKINIAQDSQKVQKFRKKLENYYSEVERKITRAAKERIKGKIEQWISDNVKDRLPVQKKGCSLFDDNTNSVPMSRSAEKIRKKIQEGYFTSHSDSEADA